MRTQIRKKNIPEVVEGAKVVGATVTIGAETQDDNSKLLNILKHNKAISLTAKIQPALTCSKPKMETQNGVRNLFKPTIKTVTLFWCLYY